MAGKRVKVLHVINGFGFGGAEIWLLEIMKRNAGEHQFDFLLTGGVKRELDDEFKKFGCNLHYLKYSGKNILNFARQLRTLVKTHKYDVVHDHEDFVAGWHWLFLLFSLPKKRIGHAHNSRIYVDNYINSFSRRLFYYGGRLLNGSLATQITGTSDRLMDELGYNRKMFQKKRTEPLYCGSQPSLFRFDESTREHCRGQFGFSKSCRVILFIGRIGLTRENEVNHKNPEFAFSIAKELALANRDYKFLFVGEKGSLGKAFEEEVIELGLADNILFLGKRNDVSRLMIASDLLIFTSTLEPFGLVLVEAQFSALPIVSSNIITPEVIEFPELFRLLDLDDRAEWLRTIESVLSSDFDRPGFAASCERKIQQSKFSVDASYKRLVKHYSDNLQ